MNTFYKTLFLALQERITANVPEIKFIDQNIGQYGFDDFRAKVAFPAVLIDFPNTSFSALAGNIQLGLASIEISLFFDVYAQTYHFAPEETKDIGLNYFEIEQKIFKALQGFDADGLCTPHCIFYTILIQCVGYTYTFYSYFCPLVLFVSFNGTKLQTYLILTNKIDKK